MVIIIKTKINEDSVAEVDPRLFLQRLIVFIQPEEINDVFNYELCIRPSSLFDKKGLMNEAHKSELKNALLVQLGLSECICLISFKIPIMFLMESHCCKDFHGLLEGHLMKYVSSSNTTCYGTVENRTVIFDGGYVVPSIKGSKHIKSKGSKRRLGRKIVPSLHNPLTVKKGDFLLHKYIKQAFLEMFRTQLSASGISVLHSDGDVDVNIVSSALIIASTCPVKLPGEDTDLLILLLWHFNLSLHHPDICIPISLKRLLISRSPSSYSVMSSHIQIL